MRITHPTNFLESARKSRTKYMINMALALRHSILNREKPDAYLRTLNFYLISEPLEYLIKLIVLPSLVMSHKGKKVRCLIDLNKK